MTRGQNSGSRARVCATTIIAVAVLLAVAGPASALTWAGPTQLTDPVTQPALNAVTCISTSVCVAVGEDELEATFNPTSLAGAKATALSTTGVVGPIGLQAVACPSADQCTALGDQGDMMTFDPSNQAIIKNKNIESPSTVGYEDVACVSKALCVAGDMAGWMFEFDPQTGALTNPKKQIDSSGSQFNGIACDSAGDQCTAVATDGIEYTFDPTAALPSPVVTKGSVTGPNPLEGIACPAANQCIAGDTTGHTRTFDPTVANPTITTDHIDKANELFGMSCVSATFCATIDGDGNAYEGAAAGTGTFNHDILPGTPDTVDDIACASTTLCVAVDGSGELFVGQPVSPPTIAKSFGAATIPLNGSTSLSFTVSNPNASTSLTGVGFTDSLPGGVVVSTPNGLTGSCGGGTITATAGSSSVSLSGATLASSASCTFSVNVTGTSAGVKNNSVTVSSTNGGTGNTATASLTVVAPPTLSKKFGAPTIALNGSTSLSFTVSNPNASTALTGVGFTDSFPSGLVVATPNGLTGSCGGGTITATAGSSSVSLSGATLAGAGSCTFSVNVKGTSAGSKVNTTSTVSSNEGGSGAAATATLGVGAGPPTIAKSFGAPTIALNGSTSLSFTITNPVANGTSTGIAFTDTLPSGLVVATPNGLTGTCGGGTITATAGSSSVKLAGATLAAGAACTLSVNVTGTSAGVKNNSVTVSSTNGGTGNTATASLTVVAPPTLAKSFGAPTIALNGSTSLSFTITNPNATTSLTGVGFTDSFPAGLVVSTPNGLTGSCGGGTITGTAGSSSVSLSGATVAGSASCTFSVNVKGTTAGSKVNTTSTVSSNEGGSGAAATATLGVGAGPPTIAKSFGAPTIPLNGSTSLSFTITNPVANGTSTGIAFTDTLPSGLVVSTPNGLTGSCGGGTITATAGFSSVKLAGATLAAGAACTFSVNVTGTSAGVKNNSVTVSSTNGGTGNTATASVTVSKAATSLTTTASASVVIGGKISDSAVLAGGSSPTGSITFDVYGPADPTCSAATPTFTSTATVNSGNGTYDSASFTPKAPGTYEFVASYSGDANNSAVAGVCNGANESVVVSKAAPTITTQASSGVVLGNGVSDTATIAGGAAPSGTVTFKLYGASDPTCASAPVFTSSAITVNGDGTYSSGSFTPSAVGTYHWVADYSGDANNTSATTHCGDANESVAVGQVSSGTTLISSLNPSIVGQSVTFVATVTGTSPTGTVTFMDGSNKLGTGTLNLSGVATFASSILSAGSHIITAVYGGDASNATSTSNPLTQLVNAPAPGGAPGAPTITITTPKSHANYGFGQVVHAKYSCSSGADTTGSTSCKGTVSNGDMINTRTPGNHTFTVTARSTDGKSATKTVTYRVQSPSNYMRVLAIVAKPSGSITVKLKLPRPGTLNLLVTAWKDDLAGAAYLLLPAPHRFVVARNHVVVSRGGALSVTVSPNAAGQELLSHPTYRVVVRLWVSYTPIDGKQRNEGYYGLHFPSTCKQVLIPPGRPHSMCDG